MPKLNLFQDQFYLAKHEASSCLELGLLVITIIIIIIRLTVVLYSTLQGDLLRSAPIPNSVKQWPEKNRGEQATGVRNSAPGRPFQAVGPAMDQLKLSVAASASFVS